MARGAPTGVTGGVPAPCVAPAKFQGQVTRLMPGIGTVVANMSYDATGERLRVLETLMGGKKPSSLDILILYKKGIVYTRNVLKGTCVKSPAPTAFPTLQVPPNATYFNRIYMGGSPKFYMDTWALAVKGPKPFYLSMSWTPDTCLPLSQTSVGQGATFDQISYYNITLGIKDPSVWNIPEGCESGTELQFPRIFSIV